MTANLDTQLSPCKIRNGDLKFLVEKRNERRERKTKNGDEFLGVRMKEGLAGFVMFEKQGKSRGLCFAG